MGRKCYGEESGRVGTGGRVYLGRIGVSIVSVYGGAWFSILSVYRQYVGASGEHGRRMYVGLSGGWRRRGR